MIYIGLPQWSHPKWARLGITSLEEYARHFNCVEGNTTLYALPKAEIVDRWYAQTTDDFRFCLISRHHFSPGRSAPLRRSGTGVFYPPGAAGNAYWPILAAVARRLWTARSPRLMAVS